MGSILIYGANGYSGLLAALHAKELELDVIVAGRSSSSIESVSMKTGFPARVFSVDDKAKVLSNLQGVSVVLNCAGPFSRTAHQLASACLEAGVHYMDITGEIEIIEALMQRDGDAKKAGVVLMPATGFDVVPTDCMARYLAEKQPDATSLELAFMSSGGLSHGTATTMVDKLGRPSSVRRDGKIVSSWLAKNIVEVDFDGKISTCVSIPWGDVASAYYTTGIPNITTYIAMPERTAAVLNKSSKFFEKLPLSPIKKLAQKYIDAKITGPSENARNRGSSRVWGRVTNAHGETLEAVLHTAEGYRLTYLTSVDIAARLQRGEVSPGSWTPAGAFGADFITGFAGSRYVEL